jgi:hypothetical protein
MQKELEQIIQEYGLENTRIQRGRRRIHPQREGLNATPQELADLRSVLEGTSVKGFLAVTSGDVVIAANTAGAIEKAFDRSSMPVQAEVSKADAPMESKTEAAIPQSIPGAARENVEQGNVVMQSNLNRNVVDAKNILKSQINPEITLRQEADISAKQPSQELDPYGPDGPNSAIGEEFESQYLEHMEKNPHIAREMDQHALLNALDRNASIDEVKQILKNGVYSSILGTEHLPEQVEQIYIAPMLEEYKNMRINALNIEPLTSASKYSFDFPGNAQTLDPVENLKNTITQGSTTVKESVLSATETLALAQKNMATFTKHVKHRGLKAWAKEQMPVLQNKAKELAQTQAAKIGAYVKGQAPVVKDAVISGAKQVGDAVVQYAKAQAPIVAEKVKAVGEVINERFTEFTQLVDPVQIEKLGNHVLGNDGGFEGTTFDFKRGQNGIDISLKNGTPVFSNGKLNPKLDTSHAIHLNQMTEKLNAIQLQTLQTENTKKVIAR